MNICDSMLHYFVDVDECSDSSHNCGEGYECVNLEGSYKCVCSAGYQLSADGSVCELITTTSLPTTAPTTPGKVWAKSNLY